MPTCPSVSSTPARAFIASGNAAQVFFPLPITDQTHSAGVTIGHRFGLSARLEKPGGRRDVGVTSLIKVVRSIMVEGHKALMAKCGLADWHASEIRKAALTLEHLSLNNAMSNAPLRGNLQSATPPPRQSSHTDGAAPICATVSSKPENNK